jgi:hypothetical protein
MIFVLYAIVSANIVNNPLFLKKLNIKLKIDIPLILEIGKYLSFRFSSFHLRF